MKVKIIKGTNQIGGSITEIASKKGTKILIDFGCDLDKKITNVPNIDFNQYSAVFITHNHEDHIGLINDIPDNIPIYVEETSLEIYKIFLDFCNKDNIKRKINTFKINDKIQINDICVTSYITDHSAFNSLMYLVECDSKRLLHTGDFRTNGYKGKLVKPIMKKIKKVDILVMEGTTLSRGNFKNKTEYELYESILETVKNYRQILILQSSTNIDRITTMYKALRDGEKIFVEDAFTANIAIYLNDLGYKIPNPKTFEDVYSFVPFSRSEYHELCKSSFYNKYILPLNKDAHIEILKKDFGLMVKQSMLKDIAMYYKKGYLNNACLIYSMWDGYKEKEDTKKFLEEIKSMNIDIVTHHTSGHSDNYARNIILNNVEYDYLIPIHTTEKEKFKKYKNAYILDDGEELEI
jgi:ribonuclease J